MEQGAQYTAGTRAGRTAGMVSYLGARVARAQIYAAQVEIYAARMHMHFPR